MPILDGLRDSNGLILCGRDGEVRAKTRREIGKGEGGDGRSVSGYQLLGKARAKGAENAKGCGRE